MTNELIPHNSLVDVVDKLKTTNPHQYLLITPDGYVYIGHASELIQLLRAKEALK